ncbi:MAG: hypothetical protein RLZZ455_541 [Candidatus Parcubacteria bacterium]|jgi:hypothetical protein
MSETKKLKNGTELLLLSNWASFFEKNVFFRHLLFLVLAVLTISLSGYYFGTFDQSIHIPFVKKDVFPALYPNDPFFELRKTHFSYFWYLFHPLYKAGVLEIGLFLTHVVATYFTFWAIWRLSLTLFKNTTAAFLSVLVFVFPHLGFAAFPIFEFSLLNRTFVFPFLLFSIEWYLKKRYVLSFLMLGILYNFHALSVHFVLFMFGVDIALRYLQGRWREIPPLKIVPGFVLFVLCALPVLLWKFGKSPLDWSLRPEWFQILSNSLMYTVFYPLSHSPNVLFLTLSGLSACVLYFLIKKRSALSSHTETVTHFMYAGLVLIGLEVIVSLWLPVTLLVQFQIVRIGIFILLFGYLYFLRSLVRDLDDGSVSRSVFFLQVTSVLLSPTPLIPIIIVGFRKFFPKKILLAAGWVLVLAGFVFFAWYSLLTDVWRPGIQIFPQKTDWYAVQMWAKENTAKDALFLTPPERWWLFEPDWRVFSERSTLATLSEVLEFAFTPEYTEVWKDKFDAVAPGARNQFRGDVLHSREVTRVAYEGLTDAQFAALALRYHISYVVVVRSRTLPFPLVYQNNSFSVYKVSSDLAGAFNAAPLTIIKIFPTIQ